MPLYALTAFSSGEPELSSAVESAVSSGIVDNFTDYINMDMFNQMFSEQFPYILAVGFAFASAFILITFGVSRALGLLNISYK